VSLLELLVREPKDRSNQEERSSLDPSAFQVD
jgi:hypothetical protein